MNETRRRIVEAVRDTQLNKGKQIILLLTCSLIFGISPLRADTFTATGSMVNAHEFHTANLLPNGKVLVAGGWGSGGVTGISELYNPSNGTWTTTGTMPVGRYLHTATLLANGKVLVVGGYGSSTLQASTVLYDPSAGTWSTSGSLITPRYQHTATLLPNGYVLVTGGTTNGSTALSSAELYNPVAGTWSAANPLATARASHTATLLPNGKVLVAGGNGSGTTHSSAALYDPVAGTWANTGTMPVARSWHTATVLTNGKVLVVAGISGAGWLSSAALYDPAAATWSATTSLSVGRYYHGTVLLPDGNVLVAGGLQSSGYNTTVCELYNTTSGTWTTTGSLNSGRYDHTVTPLVDGRVLVAGGGPASYTPTNHAEVYGYALVDPKGSGGISYSTVYYASTGSQLIARYQTPTTGYAINRRLNISPFYNSVNSFTWGFGSSSVPINGILKVPAGSGPFPLAIFAHGNHSPTAYSDEGYVYLCELLASWGILAATIDANYLNGGGGENDARAILHLEHVKQFETWHTTAGHPLYGKVNFTNVMLVGHSRGGEGVGHASLFNMLTSVVPNPGDPSVPLNGSTGFGPYGFELNALVAIAPTHGQYTPSTGTTNVRDNYLIIHGSRDGDVSDFQGYKTYDRAQPITNPLVDADGFKSLLWVHGANHNYFNSTWANEFYGTPVLTRAEQENVAKVYISTMAQAILLGKPKYLELLKHHKFGQSWLPTAGRYVSQYQNPKRIFADHYEEDAVTTTLSPSATGANSWNVAVFGEMLFDTGSSTDLYQETHGVKLSWSSPSHYYQASFTAPGLNAGGHQYLVIRIAQSAEASNPAGADQDMRIIVQDTNGASAYFNASAVSQLLYPDTGPYYGFTTLKKIVMQSLRIPLSLLRSQGLSVNNISLVKLTFDQIATGTVYFDELQVSN